jgi:hypothetical protein
MDNDIIKIETQKATSLTLLNDDQKSIISQAIKYNTMPYMPITQGFIRQIILNDGEYPLLESKISQAATEMKSRFNQLVDAQYNYNKELLEIEELELDIIDIKNSDKSEERKNLQLKKKQLELQMKHFRKESIKTSVISLFDEFKNWKETIDNFVNLLSQKDPTVKSYKDVNFNSIREKEIMIKHQRLLQMAQQGAQLSKSEEGFIWNMQFNNQG